MYVAMSGEIHDSLNKETAMLDNFFSPFSWTLLNFAAAHHLRVDKYWHNFPSFRFDFRHPKGGLAAVEVFREGETSLSIYGYWWIDDYDQGTRNGRRYRSEILPLDSIKLEDLLEETLTTVVAWPLGSWTDIATGLGDSWKRSFTKEQFELLVYDYPKLKPFLVEGM